MSASILPSITNKEELFTFVLESSPDQSRDVQKWSTARSHLEGNRSSSPKRNQREEGLAHGKIDTQRFRNAFDHNLCIDILKEGYHGAFFELFDLIEEGSKRAIGSDSLLSDDELRFDIRKDEELLTSLSSKLIDAEKAKRRGMFDRIYSIHLEIAGHCSELRYQWLSDYFHMSCLQTSKSIINSGGKHEAEALHNVGLIFARREDFGQAEGYLKSFYNLSRNQGWTDADDQELHAKACCSLKELYTAMSRKVDGRQDPEAEVEYLKKAFEMAKESRDPRLLGDASFNLGKAYCNADENDKAIECFAMHLEISEQASDNLEAGKACQMLANCHKRLGDSDKAIQLLERFVTIVGEEGQLDTQVEAYRDIANIHTSLGEHNDACRFADMAFERAKTAEHSKTVDETRVDYGFFLGNGMAQGLAEKLVANARSDIGDILVWKTERIQDFTKDEHALKRFPSCDRQTKQTCEDPQN